MESTIVFSPETDEAALSDEVDKTDEAFSEAGQIELEVDKSELEDLGPDGALEVGATGGGGGGRAGGGAGAAGAAGLASRIPKSISGSLAAAAMPVALAGGVGVGMLGAMKSASARLQTSSNLLGIAVDNFFRQPGNILDETIVRPVVDSIVGLSVEFDEAAQELASVFDGELIPPSLENAGKRLEQGAEMFRKLPLPTWVDAWFGGMEKAGELLQDFADYQLPTLEFPSPSTLASRFSWPSASGLLNKFAAPSATALVGATFGTANLAGGDILGELFGGINLSAGDVLDALTGDFGGGGGDSGGGGGGGTDTPTVGNGSGSFGGGANERTGGTSPSSGTAEVEAKLDGVRSDIQRLSGAMRDTDLRVDEKTLGELSKRGQSKARSTNLLTQ